MVQTSSPPVRLPESRKGRRSEAQQARHDALIRAFVGRLLEIRSRLDFTPGTRGWCYILENEGLITKGEFKRMEGFLGDWRKDGLLPLDFCSDDDKRAASNLESLDSSDPVAYARAYASHAASCWQTYEPVSFWKFQPCYIEMAVEKVDLRVLFEPVCAEYHVPIWNAGGWSDINSRARVMERFREHDEAGRRCVLLYCGDFDPAGLLISDVIRKNLRDLEKAVGWSPTLDRLIIDRFGLNADFIEANGLTWIDGLETGSGRNLEDPNHTDHNKPYVQDYLKKYGPRKVEGNALVARFEEGRALCRRAILRFIVTEGIERYSERLAEEREKVREVLPDVMRQMLD
jgi:hypothetical protein